MLLPEIFSPRFAIGWLALVSLAIGCSSQTVEAVSGGCDPANCAGSGGAAGSPNTGQVRPIHRYSFDANDGVQAIDSIGQATGTLVGAEFGVDENGGGAVQMAGETSGQYVDLPSHLVTGLRDATFESWCTWQGIGGPWQRIFDFGEDETGVEDSRSTSPRSYLFLAVRPNPRAAFKKPPTVNQEIGVNGSSSMPVGVLTHLAVVIDETNQRMLLYVNGREEDSTKFDASLTEIYDVTFWLGRSLYRADADFAGSMSEFRIYDRALTAAQVLASYGAGADALP